MVALLYQVYPSPLPLIASAFFTALILVQACIDLELFLLPDILNYLLLWSGLIINSFNIFCELQAAVYGATCAYLSLWIFYHIYEKITQKQGFGYGDFKLFAAIGGWLGIHKIFACIMLSCVVGILIGVIWGLKNKQLKSNMPFPFGPALALSAYIILLNPSIGV
jgi:leader peptidase (prepilin peptidase)/N-methyltransferase